MSVTREYGTTCREIGVMADLRDIGRRLDALEAGRRASEPEPREVGWYPVALYAGASPTCAWWDGKRWLPNPDRGSAFLTADNVTWIGPRLDLPEER